MAENGRASPPKTAERLGRMLVIVPYLVQHPGSSTRGCREAVRRQARAAAARPRSALHVWLAPVRAGRSDRRRGRRGRSHLDQRWPTTSLVPCASADKRRSPSPAIGRAARDGRVAAGARPRERHGKAARGVRPRYGGRRAGDRDGRAGRPAEHLETLRRAALDHERITIEYFAGSTGAWSTRDVEPEEVFSAMGNWYVAAWDVDADDERLFRADRIRMASGTAGALRASRPRGRGASPLHADRR